MLVLGNSRALGESVMRGEGLMESKNLGKAVLYGVIAIFLLAIVSSFIFSLLLRFTSVQESSLQYVMTSISFLSIFIGEIGRAHV